MQSAELKSAINLFQLGNLVQAEAKLLELGADHADDPEYWFLLGATRHRLGRLSEALEAIEISLRLQPTGIQALSARAQMQFETGSKSDALESYSKALQLIPDDPRLLTNSAIVLEALEQPAAALKAYTAALHAAPDFRDARLNRAVLCTRLKHLPSALVDYDRLLRNHPDDVEVLINRADLRLALGRLSEALADVERAQALGELDTRAGFTQCLILAALGRQQAAQSIYDALLAGDANGVAQCFGRIGVTLESREMDFHLIWLWTASKRQQVCNWNDLDQFVAEVNRFAGSDESSALNLQDLIFATLGLPVHPCTRRRIATRRLRAIDPALSDLLPAAEIVERDDGRIHVAYLGGNFRNHASALLMRRLFELHDKLRFFISVYSLAPPDDSEVLHDIFTHCDAFVELADLSSDLAARRIRQDGVQILVDVGMYSDGGRPEILASKPAPLIASYLGTEMTSGAEFVDYRISDGVLMATDRDNWVEKVIRLPGCCYPYNDAEEIDSDNLSRPAAGLAETDFVFCSFNNAFKIEPVVFALWCNILRRVPESVLWILADNQLMRDNLLREAEQRDIAGERLVFCGRESHARHLGRHRLADLFLDTLWCNAHATAMDCLWAGLPLLTCAGQTTASRVGASILSAAGLPELVAHSLEQYEDLAVELAGCTAKMAKLRQKLEHNRCRDALFDSRGSTRKLEAAYAVIWQRRCRGLDPVDIEISFNEL